MAIAAALAVGLAVERWSLILLTLNNDHLGNPRQRLTDSSTGGIIMLNNLSGSPKCAESCARSMPCSA